MMNGKMLVLMTGMCLLATLPVASQETHDMTLRVSPGTSWAQRKWMGPFPVKLRPQFAAWIETVDGHFVKTLSVTLRTGEDQWRGAPEGGRPEALPLWCHAAQEARETDALSAATPKNGALIEADDRMLEAGRDYVVRLEVNISFDYNETWPKNAAEGSPAYSGVNGQPSLVYEARFTAGIPGTWTLEPVGTGAVDGSHGELVPGIDGLTTALSLIRRPCLVLGNAATL